MRRRIDAAIPVRPRRRRARRSFVGGLALGSALSAAAAASVAFGIFRAGDDQRLLGDVVAAHLRSLQAEHLTDVLSTDQHTVKPWFNGRIDIAPPVVDLTAQGFTLLGGRLDYIDGKPAAAIVYRRRNHIINLMVLQDAGSEPSRARVETHQGFNIRRWSEQGLGLLAISDLNADELNEFGEKFDAARRGGAG